MEKDHFYFKEINEKRGRWGLLWQNCSQVAYWNEEKQLCIYFIILMECLSRDTQVAECISNNCGVPSLIKTSISTKTSLLRLSPLQRFKIHPSSAVKIQIFFMKLWFLAPRSTRTAISSCLFQTIAVKSSTTVSETHCENIPLARILLQHRRREASQLACPAVAISSAYHTQECHKARVNGRHSPNMVLQLFLSGYCSAQLPQVCY